MGVLFNHEDIKGIKVVFLRGTLRFLCVFCGLIVTQKSLRRHKRHKDYIGFNGKSSQ